MNKSLRPLCKSDDFQHLACDCISHILLLHHKFVFFVVFHFTPILTSVRISWLIFLLFTDFFWCLKWAKKKSQSEVQRAQIVALHGQNLSERQISAQMGAARQQCIKRLRSINRMASIPIRKGLEDRVSPLHEKTT